MKQALDFWNPLIETLPIEKLKALQLMKFKRTLEWAYHSSPFYRELYLSSGLEPGDIQEIRLIGGKLKEKGKEIHCVDRNVMKIFPNIRLLEMNISDIAKIC